MNTTVVVEDVEFSLKCLMLMNYSDKPYLRLVHFLLSTSLQVPVKTSTCWFVICLCECLLKVFDLLEVSSDSRTTSCKQLTIFNLLFGAFTTWTRFCKFDILNKLAEFLVPTYILTNSLSFLERWNWTQIHPFGLRLNLWPGLWQTNLL